MARFGQIGMTRPEQFGKLFRVYENDDGQDSKGRVKPGIAENAREIRCILSTAKPEEVQRFAQAGVVVTHSLIQRGTPQATPMNQLVLVKGGVETRKFRIRAVQNQGEMDILTIYFCEERSDT